MRALVLSVVAVLAAVGGTGCSTVRSSVASTPKGQTPVAEIGTGTTYSNGRASRVFNAAASAIHPAVLAAMEDLKISGVRRFNDSGVILFEGATADNRRVSLTLRSPLPGSTRLSARIGLFGDEPMSRALVERVGVRLGELPPAPIPTEIPSAPASNPFLKFKWPTEPDSEALKDMADAHFRDTAVP